MWDPTTGEARAEVLLADYEDVSLAVSAALEAFQSWRSASLAQRSRTLFAFREIVHARAEELASVVSDENGKVLSDARGEVQRGLEIVEFACGIAAHLRGEYSDEVSSGIDSYSFRQPLGVVAGIAPFNFPVMVPMWMHPIAIACGNSFVLKPSERVPTASNLVARLWSEAGLPAGVFNVVHGDQRTVEALLDHPDVAAVSFVGSTPVARNIHHRASASGKRVQALGGAKNHAVILPDADPELTADHLASAAFGSSGQRCMAISAAVVVGDDGESVVDAISRRARSIVVGGSHDPSSEMGPVITAAARDRILGLIDSGVRQGAVARVDGRGLRVQGAERGFFVGPTLLDLVTPTMEVYTNEVFGPVLSVLRAESTDEAIELVNASPYGNGCAVFTSSGAAARRVLRDVDAGMVGINVPVPVPTAHYSFGGWKDSIFGGHHIHGPEGVAFYTRGKVVTSRWPTDAMVGRSTLDMPVSS